MVPQLCTRKLLDRNWTDYISQRLIKVMKGEAANDRKYETTTNSIYIVPNADYDLSNWQS